MDGKGRATDNAFIERFFRTLKQKYVYYTRQKMERNSSKEQRSSWNIITTGDTGASNATGRHNCTLMPHEDLEKHLIPKIGGLANREYYSEMGIRQLGILFVSLVLLSSCKEEKRSIVPQGSKPDKVVLIAVDAPSKYFHLVRQDSVGKTMGDSLGPKSFFDNNGFTYLDHRGNVQTWLPKPNVRDTLTIKCNTGFLELSTHNFFTLIKETFLVKNGDTVVFEYEHGIPKAHITNRAVSDVALNYNSYRLKNLFDNKYPSHYLVVGNLFLTEDIDNYEQNSLAFYIKAKADYLREIEFLDSLRNTNLISLENYRYRKDALGVLMEKHKRIKSIKKWFELNGKLEVESMKPPFVFDKSKTDSLMIYTFFRDHLIHNSQYGLQTIEENHGNSGSFYIDSRIRFDSIVQDKRFNQTARNFLLLDAYRGIVRNFGVRDKEEYFNKLERYATNREELKTFAKKHKLDFGKSDELVLTKANRDTITYSKVLANNRGKWLYIDFWASWCQPCRKSMPASKKLKMELEKENVEFIYMALNDQRDNWIESMEADGISDGQNYFVENGIASKVIEELGINTIPHYRIYDPNGKLVNGYADRPGKGAKEQLMALIGAVSQGDR